MDKKNSTFKIILPDTGRTSTASFFPSGLRTSTVIFVGSDEVLPKSNFRDAMVSFEVDGTRTLSEVVVATLTNFFPGLENPGPALVYWLPVNLLDFRFCLRTRGEGDGIGVANEHSHNEWLRDGVTGVPTLDWLICEQLV